MRVIILVVPDAPGREGAITRLQKASPEIECGEFMAHSVSVKSIAAAFAVLLASALAAAAPNAPLVVDSNSHVVVMEYEAWFGPKAVTFQGSSAMPLLQSPDMQALGGGYDSADQTVIKQHVAWLEYMGIDAAITDLTNNVSCIFNSEWFVKKYVPNCTPSFRTYNRNIRDNT